MCELTAYTALVGGGEGEKKLPVTVDIWLQAFSDLFQKLKSCDNL